MFADVLVPFDGSPGSGLALDHALDIARQFDATVRVLYVVDESRLPPSNDEKPSRSDNDGAIESAGRDVAETVEAAGQDILSEASERAEAHGQSVETDSRPGHPPTTILDDAAAHGVDLIVLGHHPRGPIERFMDRSVAQQVVQAAPVPVLSIPDTGDETRTDYRDILLATDGRPGARRATDCAFELATRYDATLHAISVLDSRFGQGPFRDVLEREIEQTARRLRARGVQRGANVVTERRVGRPAREILEYATREGVDLIALGTHGRTGLESHLVGSVARRLLRETRVPVLTARTIDG